jgi:uncharacterized protein YceK
MRLWLLTVVLMVSGCAELRTLTMTEDELRLYGNWELRECLNPTVVCIQP